MSRVSENLYDGNINKAASTAATSTTPFGFAEAQANALVANVRELIDACRAAGILKDDDSGDSA